MNASLVAILIAVPLIAIFFLFVLLPGLRRYETRQKRKMKPRISDPSRSSGGTSDA